MFALKLIILLIVGIVIASFLILNSHGVDIHYYNLNFELETITFPLSVVLTAFVFGASFFTWILSTYEQLKLKNKLRKSNKTVKVLESELETLKLLPKNNLQDESFSKGSNASLNKNQNSLAEDVRKTEEVLS